MTEASIKEMEAVAKKGIEEIRSIGVNTNNKSSTATNVLLDCISNMTENERNKLEEVYNIKRRVYYELGPNAKFTLSGENTLKEHLLKCTNPYEYFSSLLTGFDYVNDYTICEKIFNAIDSNDDLLTNYSFLHFYYIAKIKIHYRNRDIVEGAFDKAVESCKNMISIAKNVIATDYIIRGASHPGYEQLAIILQKQHRYQEVIDLCKQAKSEKWNGDWDKRIEKAKEKLEKGAKK